MQRALWRNVLAISVAILSIGGLASSAVALSAGPPAPHPTSAAPATVHPIAGHPMLDSSGPQPSGRHSPSLDYDPNAGGALLYGGLTYSGGHLNDTWVLLGTNWSRLAPAHSPGPRGAATLAFDGKDHYSVLFGGTNATSSYLGDTWTFNGTDWTQAHPVVSPPARWGSSMAYDPSTQSIILFGGWSASGFLNDTWSFSNGSWTQGAPAVSPSARYGDALAWDASDGYLVLFGGSNSTATPGQTGASAYGDSWDYSNGTWHLLSPTVSPWPRERAALAPISGAGGVLLFGGWNATTAFGDSWSFSRGQWSSVFANTTPTGRYTAPLAYDPLIGADVLFGGGTWGFTDFGDTWLYNISTLWTNVTGNVGGSGGITSLTNRHSPALAYDAHTGAAILFGALTYLGTVDGDTWAFVGHNWTQLLPAHFPPARGAAGFAYDAKDRYSVLFGGTDFVTSYFSDTWVFNGTDWSMLTPSVSPPGRWGASMAYDPSTQSVILFGGWSSTGFLNDTWSFSNGTWTQMHPGASPSARYGNTLAWDASDGYLLLFGGSNGTTYIGQAGATAFGDTWEYSNGTWHLLSPTLSPLARVRASMAPLSSSGGVVLFGGWDPTTSYGDTWEFANGQWSSVNTSTAPPARYTAGLAYDSQAGADVMFGGGTWGFTDYGDTWLYTAATGWFDPSQSLQAPLTVAGTSGPAPAAVMARVAPSGGSGVYAVRWSFGDGTPETPDLSNLTIRHVYGGVGTFTLTVQVRDARTNRTGIAATTFTIGGGSGPAKVVLAEVPLGTFALAAQFWANATGSVPASFHLEWSFGDGTNSTSTESYSTHHYATAGTYSVTIQVVGPAGLVANDSLRLNLSGTGGVVGGLAITLRLVVSGTASPVNVTARKFVTGGTGPYEVATCVWPAPAGAAACRIDGTNLPATSQPIVSSFVLDGPGNYTVTAETFDSSGHQAITTQLVPVVSAVPLSVTTAQSATAGPAPLSVAFSVGAYGGILPYTIQVTYGDGTNGSALPGQLFVHTYRSGTFQPIVVVIDGAGHRSLGMFLPVSASAGPREGASAVPLGYLGVPILEWILISVLVGVALGALAVVIASRRHRRFRREGEGLIQDLRDEGRPPPGGSG